MRQRHAAPLGGFGRDGSREGFTRTARVSCLVSALTIVWALSANAEESPATAAKGNDVPKANAPAISTASESLKITPNAVTLRGPDAVQQVVVEAVGADREPSDRTDKATYETLDPKVATVDSGGLIVPQGDGETTVIVRGGALSAKASVTVKEFAAGKPINFANQIVPILGKLGCNSGGCHGKAAGQNGFRLSLFGFDPAFDYETLVKEDRGRRLFPAVPEQSLLILKATAKVPHGGGKKLEVGSHDYKLIARWIAGGMPFGSPKDPTIDHIEIYPTERVLKRGTSQQVVVTAFYTDKSTEDATRWAQYQSNEIDIAASDERGKVETREGSGQAAIMARYQGHVVVFRAKAPFDTTAGATLSSSPTSTSTPTVNFIDAFAAKQWRSLGIAPSELCDDSEFIRRASLDVTGSLPTAGETRAFVADLDPKKRAKLIDRVLERPEYASYFATKWADVLRDKRDGNPQLQRASFRFHAWIRDALDKNMPFDRFVRSILAANGTPETTPTVHWYRQLRTPDAFVDDTAQVFLGMRLQCAKCHHHPFEKWSQDDYYGFAAYFARVGRKPSTASRRSGRADEVIFTTRAGAVSHPRTGQVMQAKGLGSPVAVIAANEDPRQKLVDWMTEPKNPFFARALVNRYWAHFFNRGIVEPLDDIRLTNPPSNPELLDALADDFVKSKFDLKHLIRTICLSRVYGLSSVPNATNAKDKQNFARHYPRRLTAEVLLDAISQVTGSPTSFPGLPAGMRAIELPDESIGSTFLDAFGRPKRDTACECERVTDASLSQSLMLLNSGEIQQKLSAAGNRAEALTKDPRPDADKVADLFWSAFSRAPAPEESSRALAHLAALKDNKRLAFEDILWAILNTKEFQFND